MRVKRSEALRTRMETRRQNTLLATAFSNVLNNTSSSIYADTDTLDDAEDLAYRERLLSSEAKLNAPLVSADLTSVTHLPNSFVKKGAHVLSGYSDEQLDSTLNVVLRDDNSEAVFHYTGDDLKRLIFRKFTTMEQQIQNLTNEVSVERNFRMYLQTEVQSLTSRITTLEDRS